MLVKIDLKKAFDRLKWCFLDVVLSAWGFPKKFRNMVLSCISSVSYNILLNGSLCGEFFPSCGFKQGDPLSPFLFIICAKVFFRLIFQKEIEGLI